MNVPFGYVGSLSVCIHTEMAEMSDSLQSHRITVSGHKENARSSELDLEKTCWVLERSINQHAFSVTIRMFFFSSS